MIRTSQICRQYAKNVLRGAQASLEFRRPGSCFYSTDTAQEQKKKTLYRHLYSKIMACGPITVADYMKEILTHPTGGYYMSKDVFGELGDFTTSPEISQLFGEMVAVWITSEYQKMTDKPFQIVELGPGRGTLMKDILRVLRMFKFLNKVSIHLVEISPALSKIQSENLCTTTEEHNPVGNENQADSISYYRKGITSDGVSVYWYYSIKDVPRQFSVFLAHEFFDALPIHKFQKTDDGWREVLVDIIEGSQEEKFRYVLAPKPTPATQVYISKDEARTHVEISPESMAITDYMAQFLWECSGFALIFDYGHSGEKTDTFRAFSRHKQHDPLSNPGTMDLTADVDFSLIKKIAEKDDRLITFGPVTQRSFLSNLGINLRLFKLLGSSSKEQRKQLESGYKMIMEEMGTCFKVMSLFPSVMKQRLMKWPVAGFQGDRTEDDGIKTK